jgi:hypothetical protein
LKRKIAREAVSASTWNSHPVRSKGYRDALGPDVNIAPLYPSTERSQVFYKSPDDPHFSAVLSRVRLGFGHMK